MPQTFNVGARSPFVTITAWVFIVLSVLASMSAVVQNAAVASLLPGGVDAVFTAHSLPLLSRLLLTYLPWVVGIGLLLSLATLVGAIGLLLRLAWARRLFIGLLALAIAANLLGLWLQQEVVQSVVESTLRRTPLPAAAADVFGGFVMLARFLAVVTTLSACALLGWMIRRLMSLPVRQEFA